MALETLEKKLEARCLIESGGRAAADVDDTRPERRGRPREAPGEGSARGGAAAWVADGVGAWGALPQGRWRSARGGTRIT